MHCEDLLSLTGLFSDWAAHEPRVVLGLKWLPYGRSMLQSGIPEHASVLLTTLHRRLLGKEPIQAFIGNRACLQDGLLINAKHWESSVNPYMLLAFKG